MKIMFLTRSLNVGGAEHQMVLLACGLHQRGHDISVAVLYPGGHFQNVLSNAGVKVHELSKRNRWDLLGFFRNLLKLVNHEQPDILHGYHVVPNLLTICLKMMACKPKMVWGVRSSNMNLGRYDRMARLTFKASCFLSKFADLIIANSYTGKEYHQSLGYPEDKIRVVHNGIDTNRFKIDAPAGQVIRDDWGVIKNEKVIGIVARLDPMKNYELFVKAAGILAKKRTDVKFICIGDGATIYKNELHSLAKPLVDAGRFIWVGQREDMSDVYNAFDVVTNCSYTEGFPNVVGEAMSTGKLCVVTDVGDSSKIVGTHGVVVPSDNVESLVKTWERVLNSVELNNSEQIRNYITSKYSFDALIETTESILINECMN